jgi:ribosomal protein L37AE/L43A
MSKVFPCPHCQAQNFATRSRLRQAKDIPLACWKCAKELTGPQVTPEKYIKKLTSKKEMK